MVAPSLRYPSSPLSMADMGEGWSMTNPWRGGQSEAPRRGIVGHLQSIDGGAVPIVPGRPSNTANVEPRQATHLMILH